MIKKSWVSFLLLTTSLASIVVAQDESVDQSKEDRFFQIYKTYNEKPLSDELWQQIQTSQTVNAYLVQGGDTLWDLSQLFFADPLYWPKIWSLNKTDILNPHEISPGQSIQFIAGNLDFPPEILSEGSVDVKSLIVPRTQRKILPLGALPPSLPETTIQIREFVQPKVVGKPFFSGSGRTYLSYLSAFVLDRQITGLGQVIETDMSFGSASEYQYIFVKLDEAPTQKKYSIVRHSFELSTGFLKKKAYVAQIQGEIEIEKVVNVSKNIYRAKVTKNLNPIEVGALVSDMEIPVYNLNAGEIESANIEIFGGTSSDRMNLFGTGSLVLLKGGQSNEIEVGQTFSVYKNQSVRDSKSQALVNDMIIGKLKVVHVSDSFSTAVVLESSEDIRPGDRLSSDESE